MNLWEVVRPKVADLVLKLSPPAELGTITEAGLQLDNYKHPIPTWWQREGLVLPVGTRVLAVALAGGKEYWVDGPAERKGVNL